MSGGKRRRGVGAGRRLAGKAAEEVVPVLGALGAQAAQTGVLAMEGEGRLIAGRIGVVAAQQRRGSEACEPGRQAAGGAGQWRPRGCRGGSPGGGQGDGGEGVDPRSRPAGRRRAGSLPVLSQKPPRARREPGARPLKAAPPGSPRVPTSSAPAGVPRRVAAQEDGVAAAVGIERGGVAAVLEQGRGEAADTEQEVAHGGASGREPEAAGAAEGRAPEAPAGQRPGSRRGEPSRKSRASRKRQPSTCMTRSMAPPPPWPQAWSKNWGPRMLSTDPGRRQRRRCLGSRT